MTGDFPIARIRKPLVPEWLANRQLNACLMNAGVLLEGLSVEELIDIIEEENEYEGTYSPELLVMLNGVDRCFINCLKNSPVFFREVYEPWYFDTFAPRILDCKLPPVPPRIMENRGSASSDVFLLVFIVAIIAAVWCLLSPFIHSLAM